MEAALVVTDLAKAYGTGAAAVRAVDGVSFAIPRGQMWAVMGPSGCGKSTLLALLGGLLTPTAGDIVVEGHPLTRMSRRELTRFRADQVGFVFQANNLVPFLTVRENIELMARITGWPVAPHRATALIEDLGLAPRADALATDLSGGERQRTTIARALLHDPTVLLVDEPTANLDTARGVDVVRALVEQAHRHDTAGVMVTHDPRMAELSDATLLLSDGRLAAASPV